MDRETSEGTEEVISPLDVRIIGNLSPPDWWTIGLTAAATVFGAFIGALIAYIIARQTAKENREMLRSSRRDNEEAATLRAEVKLIELTNAIAGYHLNFDRNIEEAKRKMGVTDVELWRVMLGFVGKPQEMHIAADDLAAFTRAREFDYVTRLLFLFSRYNSMIYAVEAYGVRREQMMAMFTPEEMRGLVGTVLADGDKMRQMAPYIAVVNDLAHQVKREVKEVYEESLEVIDQFGPIVRKYFGDQKFPIPGRTNMDGMEKENSDGP